MSEIYERISKRSIPMDIDNKVLIDLYILMPASRRYVKFVPKGETFSKEKQEKLDKHVLPDVYVIPSEYDAVLSQKNNVNAEVVPEGFQSEILGKRATKNLQKIYGALLSEEESNPEAILSHLQNSSDQILSAVAPESKEITSIFLNNLKYVNLMNDACAVTSLAVLFAFANGFDSRKSYAELTQAALVMDISLHGFDEETKRTMYLDPESLSEEEAALYKEHPQKSYKLVSEKLSGLSEITLQLVLNHHELFNGKGFPRGVRTESLFPLVKILCLAVDVHHELKKAEYKDEESSLTQIITSLHEEEVEAHLRRHNRRITQKIIEFIAAGGQVAA